MRIPFSLIRVTWKWLTYPTLWPANSVGRTVPFIAANPTITVLQRDRQIGLSVRIFGCHECNASFVSRKSQERYGKRLHYMLLTRFDLQLYFGRIANVKYALLISSLIFLI